MRGGHGVCGAHRLEKPLAGSGAAWVRCRQEELGRSVVVGAGDRASLPTSTLGQREKPVDQFRIGIGVRGQLGDFVDSRRADPLDPAVALEVDADVGVELAVADRRGGPSQFDTGC